MQIIRHDIPRCTTTGTVASIDITGHGGALYDMNQLFFNIDAYKKLAHGSEDVWQVVFDPVNKFLLTLPENSLQQLGQFYNEARTMLHDPDDPDEHDPSLKIGVRFYHIATGIKLVDELRRFVETLDIVPAPLSEAVAKNPENADLLPVFADDIVSFYHGDYVDVLAISMVCKLLLPVLGEVIYHTLMKNATGYVADMTVESKCYNVLGNILFYGFRHTGTKLNAYVAHVVRVKLATEGIDATAAARAGFTSDRLQNFMFGRLLTWGYPAFEFSPELNILADTSTYVHTSLGMFLATLERRHRAIAARTTTES